MKEEIFYCIAYKKDNCDDKRIEFLIGRKRLAEKVFDNDGFIGRAFRIPDWKEITAVEINLTEEK